MAKRSPIQFRCPHNGPKARRWDAATRRGRRRVAMDVPTTATWETTPGASTMQTEVVCPACGARVTVVTDQKVT